MTRNHLKGRLSPSASFGLSVLLVALGSSSLFAHPYMQTISGSVSPTLAYFKPPGEWSLPDATLSGAVGVTFMGGVYYIFSGGKINWRTVC